MREINPFQSGQSLVKVNVPRDKTWTVQRDETRRRQKGAVKIWQVLSRPCPAGQTDNGLLFFLKSVQNQERKNPDGRQTRTVLSAEF